MANHITLVGDVVEGLVIHDQQNWNPGDRVVDPDGRQFALVSELGLSLANDYLVHVDALIGDDGTADGSPGKPYRTLQGAHDGWAVAHPHGNNIAEWCRKVVFILAPGLYDAAAATLTLRHHRRAVAIRGDGAIVAPQVACIADQADAPALLQTLGANLPGVYTLGFAVAPGVIAGDTYTDPLGTVWTIRGFDDSGISVYVDSALDDTIRPDLSADWNLAAGTGPAIITPESESNAVPPPQSKADNSFAEQMRIFDFAGIGGGMEGGHPAINLVFLKGIEWSEASPVNAFVDFLFASRIQTMDGGIVNVGATGGVTVELDACSIGAFGGYIGGVTGTLVLKAANSQLKAMLAGKLQIYEIDNCRIVNIDETVNPADGSPAFAGQITGNLSNAYSGITNCAFAGSTYVYTSLRLDAVSLGRLLTAGGAPDLSKITFNDRGDAVAFASTPADWNGTPPVTVSEALGRLAATLADHLGTPV